MPPRTPDPVLAMVKWPGVGLVVLGAAALLYGLVAILTTTPPPAGVNMPENQWWTLPGVLAPIGTFVLAVGLVAILVGRRASANQSLRHGPER